MFDRKRPCGSCPFRKDMHAGALSRERLDEIFNASAFQCHKTVDYSGEDREGRAGDNPQQCAGLIAVLHRSGKPNQIMQVAERLTGIDFDKYDPDGVAYDSINAVLLDSFDPSDA